jgi:hypothetical protein
MDAHLTNCKNILASLEGSLGGIGGRSYVKSARDSRRLLLDLNKMTKTMRKQVLDELKDKKTANKAKKGQVAPAVQEDAPNTVEAVASAQKPRRTRAKKLTE